MQRKNSVNKTLEVKNKLSVTPDSDDKKSLFDHD